MTLALSSGIVRVALQSFRSYNFFQHTLDTPSSVAIVGPNGAGKTNLLEALSLLTPGRGIRRSACRDLQATHETSRPWGISGLLHTSSGQIPLFTGREGLTEDKRISKISGVTQKNHSSLGEYLYALWLTPQMDGLFLGGETDRRRFLDRLVLGLFPSHGTHVLRYEKALRERHRLFDFPQAAPQWFEGLEATLAEEGLKISQNRLHFIELLQKLLKTPHGPFPSASIHIEGLWEKILQEKGEETCQETFRNWLQDQRPFHQQIKQTPDGPHKSKVCTFFRGHIPADKSSTGQQKILLISLILGACRLQLSQGRQERTFLLLLDDIAAHLDSQHRNALFETLSPLPLQVWVTDTEPKPLEGFVAHMVSLEGS